MFHQLSVKFKPRPELGPKRTMMNFKLMWLFVLTVAKFGHKSCAGAAPSGGNRLSSLLSDIQDFNVGSHIEKRPWNQADLEQMERKLASATSEIMEAFKVLERDHRGNRHQLPFQKRPTLEEDLFSFMLGFEPKSDPANDFLRPEGELLRISRRKKQRRM